MPCAGGAGEAGGAPAVEPGKGRGVMIFTGQIGVVSVDDNELVGEGVERLVQRTEGFRWDGHFTSDKGVVATVSARRSTVVLLDMELPGTDTGELIVRLNRVCPWARVLMLSAHLDREYVARCLANGASGYIGKHRDPEYIMHAIRRVAAGDFFLCEDAARLVGVPPGRRAAQERGATKESAGSEGGEPG